MQNKLKYYSLIVSCTLFLSACSLFSKNENKKIDESVKESISESSNELNVETTKETTKETIKETKIETTKETISETVKETPKETIKETKAKINNKSSSGSDKTKKKNNSKTNNLSTKAYSWSWGYPANLELLKKYNGIYNLGTKDTIYLTFDNGYEYKNLTPKILDTLKKHNVKVAFFVTSSFIKNNPSTVKRMIAEGHNVSNHTDKHLHQGKISNEKIKEDILGWERDFKKVIGHNPTSKLMRPPAGSYSETSLKIASELGYKTVFWHYAYRDYEVDDQPDADKALQKALKFNRDGSIVLLHAISETNSKILDEYIKKTKSQGYRFELLE